MPLIGEIMVFGANWAPRNWLPCDGSMLLISAYRDLYNVLGNRFGGDNVKTFAVPNLSGRIPLHFGQSQWLPTKRDLGSSGGAQTVLLTVDTMATHRHLLGVSSAAGKTSQPCGGILAQSNTRDRQYATPTPTDQPNVAMRPGLADMGPFPTTPQQPHMNVSAALVVNFIICYQD